jgi:hypothetical protein
LLNVIDNCGLAFRDVSQRTRLHYGLVAALELYALDCALSHTLSSLGVSEYQFRTRTYKTFAKAIRKELLHLNANNPDAIIKHAQKFVEVISPWIEMAYEVTDPDAMDYVDYDYTGYDFLHPPKPLTLREVGHKRLITHITYMNSKSAKRFH